jgi:hypothetical protein
LLAIIYFEHHAVPHSFASALVACSGRPW